MMLALLIYNYTTGTFGQITVAVDGNKVLANACKHSAVSCEPAG
jgi:hypothetical protein